MGLLSSLLNKFSGSENHNPAMITEILSWIDSQGGMETILQQMKLFGFGKILQSWLSNQENLPISAQQVFSFIKAPALQQLADRCGIDVNATASLLSKYLPLLVNGLSHSGELMPSATSDLVKAGLSVLGHKTEA